MALNSLKIATDGYIKQTSKVALIIAVSGYLNYGGNPPIPPTPPVNPNFPTQPFSPSGGFGGVTYIEPKKNKVYEEEDLKKQIEIEDSEIIAIVKIALKNIII